MLWKCLFWLAAVPITVGDCVTISNANTIFEMFSPRALVRFFELSDQGWNISADCIKDMYQFLDALQKEKLWALKLFDASAYYAGGYFGGTLHRYVPPDQCRGLNAKPPNQPANEEDFQDQFIFEDDIQPFEVAFTNAKYEVAMADNPASAHIIQSICMPRSCNLYDLSQVLAYSNVSKSEKVVDVELVELRAIPGEYSFIEDNSFHIIMLLTFSSLILLSTATIYEYFYRISRKKTMPMVPPKKPNLDCKVLKHLVTIGVDEELKATSIAHTSNYGTLIPLPLLDDDPFNYPTKSEQPISDSMIVNTFNSLNNQPQVTNIECKLKPESPIGLDIISANCYNAFILQKKNNVERNKKSRHRSSEKFIQFSHQSHVQALFDVSTAKPGTLDEIRCIHGIRTLCWLGVVVAHVTTFLFFVGDNVKFRESHQKRGAYFFISRTGSYSIDTFFFLGGLSMYFSFHNSTNDMKIEKICSIFKQTFQYSTIVTIKLLRLTLPYVVALHLLMILSKYFDDNSMIAIPSNDHLVCEANYWRNLLYVDIFRPCFERCMPWTWFIAVEVQFYIVGALLLMISRTHRRYATVILLSFYVSSVITTVLIRVYGQSKVFGSLAEDALMEFNGIYREPWVRIGPYVVGIFFGYFLKRTDSQIHYKAGMNITGWCLIGVLMIMLGMTENFTADMNVWIQSGFATINHTVWAIILVWLIYLSIADENGSINRLLSMSIFNPLSKLTNCMILIHPLVTRYLILGANATIHLTNGIILIYCLGMLLLAIVAALLLHYLFEAPSSILLSIIYNKIVKII